MLVLLFDVPATFAFEAAGPDAVLDQVRTILGGITSTLLGYARNLFIGLATVSLAVGLIQMMLSGESTLGSVMAHLTRWILYVGFFMLIMREDGVFFIPNIISASFLALSEDVAQGSLSPGGLLTSGIQIFTTLTHFAGTLGWTQTARALMIVICAIVILVVFAMLTATLAATLIEMYIVIAGGAILLGFAGISYTKDIALNYLKYAVSVGVKLVVIAIIARLAAEMATGWASELRMTTWTQFFGTMGFLLGGSVTLLISAQMVPGLAQSIVSGSSVSSGGALGTAAGVAGAAGMVAGAAKASLQGTARGVAKVGLGSYRGYKSGGMKGVAGAAASSAYSGLKSAVFGADSKDARSALGDSSGSVGPSANSKWS